MDRSQQFNQYLEVLRRKWYEVPASPVGRISTIKLLKKTNSELVKYWKQNFMVTSEGRGWEIRGWYHTLYADTMRSGVHILDVGSGLGTSSIHFAQLGAEVTFMDIIESNLVAIQRICHHLGFEKRVHFTLLRDLKTIYNFDKMFDVIMVIGSLHHMPYNLVSLERQALAKLLRPGGRWLELGYPKERWIKEGKIPFSKWGKYTDGEDTPWAEWYNLKKLKRSLEPVRFQVVFHKNFHNDDFNWFDLIKIS